MRLGQALPSIVTVVSVRVKEQNNYEHEKDANTMSLAWWKKPTWRKIESEITIGLTVELFLPCINKDSALILSNESGYGC